MSFSGGKSKSNQSNASQQYGSGQNYSSNNGVNFGVNQSGSSQDVWGGQSPYLTDMYGSANGAYSNAMGGINGMTPQVSGQVQGAYGAGSGAFNNLAGGGQQMQMLNSMGQNPYIAAMKDQVAADAGRMKQQTLGSLDGRAAAAGMSGSSGYRDQVGQSFSNIDQQAMDAMSNISYNSFNQDLQNKMALARGIDSNYANAMNGTVGMQGAAMNQFNPFMAGLNATNQYAGILGGPTVLGNSFSNGMNVGVNTGGSMGSNQNWGNSSGTGSSSSWNLGGGLI